MAHFTLGLWGKGTINGFDCVVGLINCSSSAYEIKNSIKMIITQISHYNED